MQTFQPQPVIAELQTNRWIFESLLSSVPQELQTWRPAPEKWCLLEIACHLYDEEREDFRARVRHTLETPGDPMPSIDPAGWVTTRNYMSQDYGKVVKDFLIQREKSVAWLSTLTAPQWNQAYQHPKFGAMTAQMFLCNWLAHDYLHIRQITALKFQWLKHTTGEDLQYAGNW